MAVSADDIQSRFPLPAYNYKVRIDGESHSFAQVSGLSLRYETITYRTGMSWFEGEFQMPGKKQPINLTLERGVVKARSLLFDWIDSIQLNTVSRKEVIIDLCDDEGNPLVSWTVENAFPTQLDAPSFDASTNEVAIESLQLIANGLKITYHS